MQSPQPYTYLFDSTIDESIAIPQQHLLLLRLADRFLFVGGSLLQVLLIVQVSFDLAEVAQLELPNLVRRAKYLAEVLKEILLKDGLGLSVAELWAVGGNGGEEGCNLFLLRCELHGFATVQ
jgi:hypothetical protein